MKKSGIHTINAGALEKSPITPGCLFWEGDIPGRGLSINADRDMLACSLARCLLLLLATRLFPLTAKSPQSANQGFHGRQERIPFKCRASPDSLKLYGLGAPHDSFYCVSTREHKRSSRKEQKGAVAPEPHTAALQATADAEK